MEKFTSGLDCLAGIETEDKRARFFERVAFVFLVLMFLFEPHSIAATQIAWLLGMSAWLARLVFKPRPPLVRTPLNLALWLFFGWTVITCFLSYAPEISVGKIHGATTFLIFYFVLNNLRTARAAAFVAFALIFSCLASALWSPVERLYGRGVEIHGVAADGVLTKGTEFNHDVYLGSKGKNLTDVKNENPKSVPLVEGDTVLEADGEKVRTPEDLAAAIERQDKTFLECFRSGFYFTVEVRRADLRAGETDVLGKLGVESWRHNRGWRYGGFYAQIISYAEVVQMIASLALGLFVASFLRKGEEGNRNDSTDEKMPRSFFELPFLLLSFSPFLLFSVAALIFALATTFTRSAEIAFAASSVAVVALGGSRRMLLTLLLILAPLVAAAFFLVEQNRGAGGAANARDESVFYRQTVYREGLNLWTRDARKFFVGIGMDSTKEFGKQWHLYDDGRLMTSHFHSTPLQLLVERGLPALLLWLWILWLYARTLLRGTSNFKFQISNAEPKTAESAISNLEFGILLGCFGGLVGFFASSAVNYSLGDSKVAMAFFMLMGVGVFLSARSEPSAAAGG